MKQEKWTYTIFKTKEYQGGFYVLVFRGKNQEGYKYFINEFQTKVYQHCWNDAKSDAKNVEICLSIARDQLLEEGLLDE